MAWSPDHAISPTDGLQNNRETCGRILCGVGRPAYNRLHDNEPETATDTAVRRLVEHLTLKAARKLIVLVIGTTVVLFGVVLIFIPGPAIVVIPTGLAILATEFVWARRLLRRVRRHVTDLHNATFGNRRGQRPAEETSSTKGDGATESGRTVKR